MRAFLVVLLLLPLALPNCRGPEAPSVEPLRRFYGAGSATVAEGVAQPAPGRPHGRYFGITLAGGMAERMEQSFQTLHLPASNCAYLFYRQLSPRHRATHAFVRITLKGKTTSSQFEFPLAHLARVERSEALLKRALPLLQAGDYDALLAKGNPWGGSVAAWQRAKPRFRQLDSDYGRVCSFSLQGFAYLTPTLGGRTRPLIRLAGVLVRAKRNHQFAWVVDPNAAPQSPYLYGFNFRMEPDLR
ncbi:hypothetical protein [Hymenobacter koreensis]